MKFSDIKKALNPPIREGESTIVFRPTCGGGFIELNKISLNKALDEIIMKSSLVELGVDEFTECEKLMFQLFLEHAEYGF